MARKCEPPARERSSALEFTHQHREPAELIDVELEPVLEALPLAHAWLDLEQRMVAGQRAKVREGQMQVGGIVQQIDEREIVGFRVAMVHAAKHDEDIAGADVVYLAADLVLPTTADDEHQLRKIVGVRLLRDVMLLDPHDVQAKARVGEKIGRLELRHALRRAMAGSSSFPGEPSRRRGPAVRAYPTSSQRSSSGIKVTGKPRSELTVSEITRGPIRAKVGKGWQST